MASLNALKKKKGFALNDSLEAPGSLCETVASFEECFRDGSTISDFEGPAASATVTAEAQ